MAHTLYFTSSCRVCNPYPQCDPVLYDEQEKRDYEAQQHCSETGHIMDIGFVFL